MAKDISKGEDEVTVSVGPDQVSGTVRGDAAGRLGHSFLDLLSVFTDGAGALGDMIRAYRQENAIRAMARAKELSEELGVNAVPIPPKFLLQWTEAASLEEPGEGDLAEQWANLLVSAQSGLKPTHLVFKRILSEINIRHIELLRWLCEISDEKKVSISDLRLRSKNWNKYFSSSDLRIFPSYDSEQIVESILSVERPGLKMIRYLVGTAGAPLWFMEEVKVDKIHNDAREFIDDHTFEYLRLAGLIEEISDSEKCYIGEGGGRGMVEVKAWYLTDLGFDFINACHASELKN